MHQRQQSFLPIFFQEDEKKLERQSYPEAAMGRGLSFCKGRRDSIHQAGIVVLDTEIKICNQVYFEVKMLLKQQRRAIAVFSARDLAENAFDQLILSGFPLSKLFLLGQPSEDDRSLGTLAPQATPTQIGAITGTATGLKKGLVIGNMAGGTAGFLLGVGLLALPGMGHLVLSAAIALTLISTGACTAAGGMIGVLIGLGLTSEQAKAYAKQLDEGKSLLVVEGTAQEILRAERILSDNGIAMPKLRNQQF